MTVRDVVCVCPARLTHPRSVPASTQLEEPPGQHRVEAGTAKPVESITFFRPRQRSTLEPGTRRRAHPCHRDQLRKPSRAQGFSPDREPTPRAPNLALVRLRDTHQLIMSTQDPREQKELGRKVKGFVPDVWEAVSLDIVIRGNLAKFRQNPGLKDKLLATGDKVSGVPGARLPLLVGARKVLLCRETDRRAPPLPWLLLEPCSGQRPRGHAAMEGDEEASLSFPRVLGSAPVPVLTPCVFASAHRNPRTHGAQILAEASPFDSEWGIGMQAYDPDVLNPRKWRGKNKLGEALMDVRRQIKEELYAAEGEDERATRSSGESCTGSDADEKMPGGARGRG